MKLSGGCLHGRQIQCLGRIVFGPGHTAQRSQGSKKRGCETRLCLRAVAETADQSQPEIQPEAQPQAEIETQPKEAGKFISSTPIPAFIPREDLMQQLFGWARIECSESGAIDYGLPMRVRTVTKDDGELWGFVVSILSREGAVITDIRVMFDDKEVTKHQWVGRGGDGFPTLEGNETKVVGDELIIRKIDDNPIDDTARTAIKAFCVKLVEAINKYYAFGSCFVDEAT